MKAALSTATRRYTARPAYLARVYSANSKLYFSTNTQETPHTERELQGGLNSEQLLVIDEMFGKKMRNLEAQVKVLRQKVQELDPTFAVDGPDGDSLGHEIEEQLEVKHIIDEAALSEDKGYVEKVHKLEDEVKKFHARDPEHDW